MTSVVYQIQYKKEKEAQPYLDKSPLNVEGWLLPNSSLMNVAKENPIATIAKLIIAHLGKTSK